MRGKGPQRGSRLETRRATESSTRTSKQFPDWVKVGALTQLASCCVQLEIEAHPALAGLPDSVVQLDNDGDVVRLAKGTLVARQSD